MKKIILLLIPFFLLFSHVSAVERFVEKKPRAVPNITHQETGRNAWDDWISEKYRTGKTKIKSAKKRTRKSYKSAQELSKKTGAQRKYSRYASKKTQISHTKSVKRKRGILRFRAGDGTGERYWKSYRQIHVGNDKIPKRNYQGIKLQRVYKGGRLEGSLDGNTASEGRKKYLEALKGIKEE